MINQDQVIEELKKVKYPGFSRDIVSFGIIQSIDVREDKISILLMIKSQDTSIGEKIKEEAVKQLKESFPKHQIDIGLQSQKPSEFKASAEPKASFLANAKYKIAVASGKGGVGKSTVATNLAVAMAKRGLKVGLLDVDIYGPSIPLMLGVDEKPYYDGEKIHTIQRYGVELMSLGFLIDKGDPVIWRGSLVHRAIQQLMGDVKWPDLDVVLFDMPPGTGDAQLTLTQSVSLDGVVIVSTPQDVALADAIKGVQMFRKVNVPILGIVENMSYFLCPHCGERTEIFSYGGAKKECERLGTELLGEIPIDAEIRIGGDEGKPIVVRNEESPQSKAFMDIADKVKALLK